MQKSDASTLAGWLGKLRQWFGQRGNTFQAAFDNFRQWDRAIWHRFWYTTPDAGNPLSDADRGMAVGDTTRYKVIVDTVYQEMVNEMRRFRDYEVNISVRSWTQRVCYGLPLLVDEKRGEVTLSHVL